LWDFKGCRCIYTSLAYSLVLLPSRRGMWGTYQHRKRSCHIPPNTSLHYLHPLIRIHIIDRFGTLKRGFGGGLRILDLLSGSHQSSARYTRVCGLLSISRYSACEGKVHEKMWKTRKETYRQKHDHTPTSTSP
jgi:hypothetical protein